jgi:DNA primase
VKVNPQLLAGVGKENVRPIAPVAKKHDEAELQAQAEKLRKQKEEQERIARLAEEQRKLYEEKRLRELEAARAAAAAEKERLRQEALAAERARMEQEAIEQSMREEQQRKAEEERAQQEAEEPRRRQEQQRAEEMEKREALVKINTWCKANGYQDMNAEKKTFKGKRKHALHTAVKQENQAMVELMIKCGANKAVKDSNGNTPVQLADKLGNGAVRDRMLLTLR